MTLRELWERGEPTVGGWCVIPSAFAAELPLFLSGGAARVLETLRGVRREVAKTGY